MQKHIGSVLILTDRRPNERDHPVRHRASHPIEYLRAGGVQAELRWIYELQPSLDADLVILSRARLDGAVRRLQRRARAKGAVIAYDTDDLLFEPDAAQHLRRIGKEEMASADDVLGRRAAMLSCDCVLVSTTYLQNIVSAVSDSLVLVLRNGLSAQFVEAAESTRRDTRQGSAGQGLTLGYFSGSSTHDHDFAVIAESLVLFMRRNADTRLVVVGPIKLPASLEQFGERIEQRPFVPYAKLPSEIARVDVNLVPLEVGERFCEAKSEVKYYESAVCGVPSIASATGTFREVITHGENGWLAGTPDEWSAALADAAVPARRHLVAETARLHALSAYSPRARSREWLGALAQIDERYADVARRRSSLLGAMFLDAVELARSITAAWRKP